MIFGSAMARQARFACHRSHKGALPTHLWRRPRLFGFDSTRLRDRRRGQSARAVGSA